MSKMASFNLQFRPDFELSDDAFNFLSDYPCSEIDPSRSIFDQEVMVSNQPFPDEQLCSTIDQIVPPVGYSSSPPSDQFGGLMISHKSTLTADEVAQYKLLTNHLNQTSRLLGMKMTGLEVSEKQFSCTLPKFGGSGEDDYIYSNGIENTDQNMLGRKRHHNMQLQSSAQNHEISVDNSAKDSSFAHNQLWTSPGNNSLYQNMKMFYELMLMNPEPNLLMPQGQTCSSGQTSAASDVPSMAETYVPLVPYTPEQRKQSIDRYRAKRSQRNYNKTIKYVCRKTLADSRPRVRGRFTRNNEYNVMPSATNGHQIWEGLLNGGGFTGTMMMGGGNHF